jgi:hypothetical protein
MSRLIPGAVAAAIIAVAWLTRIGHDGTFVLLGHGFTDCERVVGQGLAQSANATSSLAVVAAGILLFDGSFRGRSLLGLGAMAAGTGSAIFHGTFTDLGATLDGLGVAALIATIAAISISRQMAPRPGLAFTAVLAPAAAMTFTDGPVILWLALALVAALGVELRDGRSRPLVLAIGMAAFGFGAWVLGQSSSPLCEPNSWFQFHALWHLAAAGSLLALGSHYGES